jgi:predicted transposase YbfD/YdcC
MVIEETQMSQTHATKVLAQQIRRRLKGYIVPAEILDNLTDTELLELRAMSKAMKKNEPQAYAGVKDTAIDFIRSHKKANAQ